MKFVTLYTLMAFFVLGFNCKAQSSNCNTTDKKISKVINEALAIKNFDQQVQALAMVVKKYPNNVQAYYLLAKLHYFEGMRLSKQEQTMQQGKLILQKALVFYKGSIQKCPSYEAEAYLDCAKILYYLNENAAALSYLEDFMHFDSIFPGDHSENYFKLKNDFQPVYKELRFAPEAKKHPVPFNVIKVAGASSEEDEYFPMLSPDNSMLFYTRKADKTNLGDIAGYVQEEFTLSNSENDLDFDKGRPLDTPFNDGRFYNYGSASLSADNRELIICACKVERVYNQDYLNCDLYSSRFEASLQKADQYDWGPLINLGPNINTKDGWEAQPSLSSDGKILYFTSLRKGSQDNDIYFSEKQSDGTWGQAQPFDLINTPGKDKSPFFHQDGETFYFVSQTSRQRPGMGGLDIFMMRKEADGWGPIVNLGYPINTEGDELGLFVSTDGKRAYFSSSQNQNWDIYSFDLYSEARPKETKILTGKLQDSNGNSISKADIHVRYEDEKIPEQHIESNEDGSYAIAVRVDQKISLEASKTGYSFQAQILDTIQLKSANQKLETSVLKIDSIKEGSAYAIEAIIFDTDAATLSKSAQLLLRGFAAYLRSNSNLNIQINGHTDDVGDAQHNLILSQKRAKAVADYLILMGVFEQRIAYKGFGKEMPRVPNDSDSNRALNRRTEFQIISFD